MSENTEVVEGESVQGDGLDKSSGDAVHAEGSQPTSLGSAFQEESVAQQLRGRATGPRTPGGRLISSKNSLKYGIFARELVIEHARWIPTERKKNFTALLRSYVDHYRPEGPVEMHQVELAVSALWRYRRLLRAEAGEIQERRRLIEPIFDVDDRRPPDVIDQRGSIPGPKVVERLQRYEAHLLRIYYRAVAELERLQRMRLGDMVPPPVVVEVRP